MEHTTVGVHAYSIHMFSVGSRVGGRVSGYPQTIILLLLKSGKGKKKKDAYAQKMASKLLVILVELPIFLKA